jgi:hypothetical protein
MPNLRDFTYKTLVVIGALTLCVGINYAATIIGTYRHDHYHRRHPERRRHLRHRHFLARLSLLCGRPNQLHNCDLDLLLQRRIKSRRRLLRSQWDLCKRRQRLIWCNDAREHADGKQFVEFTVDETFPAMTTINLPAKA